MRHTLKPIDPPYSAAISDALEQYPRTKDGCHIQLFRVFANSLRFLRGKGVANLLDKDSPLTLRQRELVILRTTANNDCEYEWGIHVSIFATVAGLTDIQVRATRCESHNAPCWSPEDSVLIKIVDELCRFAKVQDETYELFRDIWTGEQQLEILALCGNYQTVCFVANTTRLPSEKIGRTFPAE